MTEGATVHASAIVIGEAGVLIRGPSGSGKTSLAFALLEATERRGRFARLVADDRVRLVRAHGRLIAEAPEPIAGLAELRGLGIVTGPHIPAAVVRLVVDIMPQVDRAPEPDTFGVAVEGLPLPRLPVAVHRPDSLALACQHVFIMLMRCCSDRSALAFAAQHGTLTASALSAPLFRSTCADSVRSDHGPERNRTCAETA